MNCSKCGHELKEEYSFCMICGEPVVMEDPVQKEKEKKRKKIIKRVIASLFFLGCLAFLGWFLMDYFNPQLTEHWECEEAYIEFDGEVIKGHIIMIFTSEQLCVIFSEDDVKYANYVQLSQDIVMFSDEKSGLTHWYEYELTNKSLRLKDSSGVVNYFTRK